MHLTATIRQRPAEHARHVDDLETRTIVGTGDTYDAAKADLDPQVPDGWQLLHVRGS